MSDIENNGQPFGYTCEKHQRGSTVDGAECSECHRDALYDYSRLSKDELISECKRLYLLNGRFMKEMNHYRSECHRLCEKLLERGKKIEALEASTPKPEIIGVDLLLEALRFYASADACSHVDEEIKQEYVKNRGWGDFGDFARYAIGAYKKANQIESTTSNTATGGKK